MIVESTAEQTPDLSIVVVSYNTREMTLACIASVIAETHEVDYEIVVVDNASSDGSAEAVRLHAPTVRLIEPGRNLGFALANNLAVEQARGRHVLLLNPDTIVLDRAVDRLMAFAYQRPQAGIWGGRTLFADGRLNPSSCWAAMTPWGLFCRASGLAALLPERALANPEAYGGWDRRGVREVDIVSGCFLLIERETWQALGGFDERYFMYGEDADLCLRARHLGARPAVTSAATIVHYGGALEPARASKLVKLLTAKATLLRLHWQPALIGAGLALLAAWPASRLAASHLLALATREARWRTAAAQWGEVWQARQAWLAGYPPAPVIPTESERASEEGRRFDAGHPVAEPHPVDKLRTVEEPRALEVRQAGERPPAPPAAGVAEAA
jgi:N-acetylglucosaminyl-diphospho-decaprenol L-rhamnosyltransferase